MKRLMRSLLLIAFTTYGLFFLYFYFFADRLVFQPHAASYRDDHRFVRVAAADGIRLTALYLPNPQARYTLLFSHGNAEDLGDNLDFLEGLQQAGFAVLAWDYRGYGTSEGAPSEKTIYADEEAVYSYLVRELKTPPERILVLGRSLGSTAAVDLAARQPVAGLILEGGLVSGQRLLLPFPLFPFDRFRNLDKIGRVRCPVLVIHGTADNVIPFHHGESLFRAAHEPKRNWWVQNAGHNDLAYRVGPAYGRKLREFAAWVDEQKKP
ncbi:MAG: alpha/beta hydrolase [Terriglobales bacterium]